MSDRCDASIRPFPNDTEIRCVLDDGHDGHFELHKGVVWDYAYDGSRTEMTWAEDDRRTFHDEWPGACDEQVGCILPLGHHGSHAT